MLVAWHGDGQEVTRHTVEGLAEFRLGVWILLVVGLFGLDQGQPDLVTSDRGGDRSESRIRPREPPSGVRLAA